MSGKIDVIEASDLLGVLPESFMRMAVKYKLSFTVVDGVTMFDKVEVVEFKQQRRKEQMDAFAEMRELDQKYGVEE